MTPAQAMKKQWQWLAVAAAALGVGLLVAESSKPKAFVPTTASFTAGITYQISVAYGMGIPDTATTAAVQARFLGLGLAGFVVQGVSNASGIVIYTALASTTFSTTTSVLAQAAGVDPQINAPVSVSVTNVTSPIAGLASARLIGHPFVR